MITPKKIAEIKRQLTQGMPAGEIKNALKNDGYSDADIKLAFAPKPIDMRSWFLTFGLLFVALGCFVLKEHNLHCILFGVGLLIKYYLAAKKMENKTD